MFFNQPITLKRVDGEYEHGIWKTTSTQTLTVYSSVQPAKETELQFLPEDRTGVQAYKLYTKQQVYRLRDGGNSDVITFKGQDYEVAHVEDWSNSLIPHFKTIVVRMIDA